MIMNYRDRMQYKQDVIAAYKQSMAPIYKKYSGHNPSDLRTEYLKIMSLYILQHLKENYAARINRRTKILYKDPNIAEKPKEVQF